MARAGLGEPFIVSKPDEAPAKAEEFRKVIQSPLLTRIKLNLDRFEAYELEPSGIPDVFAERPVVVVRTVFHALGYRDMTLPSFASVIYELSDNSVIRVQNPGEMPMGGKSTHTIMQSDPMNH